MCDDDDEEEEEECDGGRTSIDVGIGRSDGGRSADGSADADVVGGSGVLGRQSGGVPHGRGSRVGWGQLGDPVGGRRMVQHPTQLRVP